MVTSCNFEEMTLFLQSGCKTNSLWTFSTISETHHVPPDFEIYVEWYLTCFHLWELCFTNLLVWLVQRFVSQHVLSKKVITVQLLRFTCATACEDKVVRTFRGYTVNACSIVFGIEARHGYIFLHSSFTHGVFSRLLRHAWGYGGYILDLSPRVPTGFFPVTNKVL